jgi:hypothetical protein
MFYVGSIVIYGICLHRQTHNGNKAETTLSGVML